MVLWGQKPFVYYINIKVADCKSQGGILIEYCRYKCYVGFKILIMNIKNGGKRKTIKYEGNLNCKNIY